MENKQFTGQLRWLRWPVTKKTPGGNVEVQYHKKALQSLVLDSDGKAHWVDVPTVNVQKREDDEQPAE
jgi:hypothetical protein